MRRKLLFITVTFILGIIIAIHKSIMIMFFIVLLFIFTKAIYKNQNFKRTEIIILIIFILLGSLRIIVTDNDIKRCYIDGETSMKITCKVNQVEKKDDKKYNLLCTSDDLGNTSHKILVSYYKEIEKPWELYGNSITFYGKVSNPKEAGNPRCFDYKKYLRSEEIYIIASTSFYQIINTDKSIIDKIKEYIIEKRELFISDLHCNDEVKGFVRGIIFGDKSQLDEQIYEDFRNNGTAHILAVSGLHVGILYKIYRKLLEKQNSKCIHCMFFLILLGYGTLTLWSVSVTRAIVLVFIVTIGNLLDRRYDLITALSAIAFYILLKNPYMIENTAFQMSFLAVLSIGFITPVLNRKFSKNLSTMLAVQIGMIPYTVFVFNYIPVIGILCNIPIIFLTSILVPLGLGTFVVWATTKICFAFGIMSSVSELLIWANKMLSCNGRFSVDVTSPNLGVIVLIYLSLFYLCSEKFYVDFHRNNRRSLAVFSALIVVLSITGTFVVKTPFEKAFLVFVDVGQGDCIHLKSEKNILIDGGGNINYNIGKKVLKPYLLKNGVRHIDVAAATHLHTDHYLGLEQLSKVYIIKNMIIKGKAGDKLLIDEDTYIEVLWPINPDENIDDENLNSLIFMVHYKKYSVLITGDITSEGESKLIEYYKGTDKLNCDVLKIAHHGSKYSTSDEFISKTSPSIAVISVGKNNYGHPSNEVIEKLNKKGIILFRTDQMGAVGLIDNKGKISICIKKQE